MRTSYKRSYSLDFVSEIGPTKTDVEDICDQVHALNESVQRQFKEVNKRYMDLYQRHERDKEQQTQQM